jgi:hypothetical protein
MHEFDRRIQKVWKPRILPWVLIDSCQNKTIFKEQGCRHKEDLSLIFIHHYNYFKNAKMLKYSRFVIVIFVLEVSISQFVEKVRRASNDHIRS